MIPIVLIVAAILAVTAGVVFFITKDKKKPDSVEDSECVTGIIYPELENAAIKEVEQETKQNDSSSPEKDE